jgi:hypothetical protein
MNIRMTKLRQDSSTKIYEIGRILAHKDAQMGRIALSKNTLKK